MTYDDRGRWTRTDRPELLSDRLGYPPERGDQDWAAMKTGDDQLGQSLRGTVPGMDDLVVWLRQQLDDDERVARKAAAFPYDHPMDAPWEGAKARVKQFGGTSSDPHIARHDPARVLREVEAKRRIVDEHVHEHATEDPGFGCRVCAWQGSWSGVGDDGWCLTLRLLALPYVERPGYREQWKP